jgi:hypothetical protein
VRVWVLVVVGLGVEDAEALAIRVTLSHTHVLCKALGTAPVHRTSPVAAHRRDTVVLARRPAFPPPPAPPLGYSPTITGGVLSPSARVFVVEMESPEAQQLREEVPSTPSKHRLGG